MQEEQETILPQGRPAAPESGPCEVGCTRTALSPVHNSWQFELGEIPAGRAAGLISDSQVILLDSGHFLPMSNPEVIARELQSFFVGNHRLRAELPAAAD